MAREPLVIGPFAGGLNTYDDPTAVRDTELVECLNWDPGLEGSLRSRPPFQNLGTPMTLGPTGDMTFLGFFYTASGGFHLIASDGSSKTYHYVSGVWTVITNTFAASAMVQFDNKAWLVAPVGSTNPGGYWAPSGGFTADADMPKGDTIVAHKSRLWVSPGRGNPNGTRLYYSKVLGQPSFWATPSFIDVGQGDGQDIVLLSTYYNSLVVFRTQSIYSFAYTSDPAQGQVALLVPGIGIANKESLVSHENYLYFMYDEKAFQFVNNNAQQINLKVPFTALNKANIPLPFSVSLFNNRAIFHYYDTMYVYSLRTRTWTKWRSPQYGAVGRLASPSGVLTDEAFVFPSASQPPEVVRTNWAVNPHPRNNSATEDWGTRWGATRVFDGDKVTWTLTAARDSGGVGFDIKSNIDTTPVAGVGVPVTAGDIFYIGAEVEYSSSLDVSVDFRIHDGVNWLNPHDMGPYVAMSAGVPKLVGRQFTVPLSGFMVARIAGRGGVSLPSGTTIKAKRLRFFSGDDPLTDGYFSGSTAKSDNHRYAWWGVSDQSRAFRYALRKAPLLYITEGLGTSGESFTCEVRTKNYNYQLSSNFKRLFWWGVDAVFRGRIRGSANPVVQSATVSWNKLYSSGVTWGDLLLTGTWGMPSALGLEVLSDYDLANTGPSRKFIKMFKSLRFRQIYFSLIFDTDGTLSTAPVNLFTITAYVETKETVVKTVS